MTRAPTRTNTGHDHTLTAPSRVLAALVRGIGRLLSACPAPCLALVARFLAFIWFHLIPVRRKVALQNLESAFGETLSRAERTRIARRMGYHLALNYLEFLTLPFLDRPRLISKFQWEGRHHLENARAKGHGVLVLCAHIGAFDLLAAAAAAEGLPLHIVSRTPRSPLAREIWMGYRAAAGIRILPERGSVFAVLRALRQGHIVVFMLDQNMHADRGVFVQFFDRPACTLDSLAVLALRTRAPVIPVFTRRLSPRRHLVRCLPEVTGNINGGQHARIVAMTQTFTHLIEAEVRTTPDQWLWVHRRWKTQPPKRLPRADGSEHELPETPGQAQHPSSSNIP